MPDPDRRRPAVHSDELRRQLRERDQECYHLRSEMERSTQRAQEPVMTRTPPLLVAAISAVAVLGISGGAVLWNHCASDAPLADAQVTLAYQTVSAPLVNESPAYPASIDVPAESATSVAARTLTARGTRQPTRHAPHQRFVAARVITRTAEHRPRPLSPGEFGRPRRTSSSSRTSSSRSDRSN